MSTIHPHNIVSSKSFNTQSFWTLKNSGVTDEIGSPTLLDEEPTIVFHENGMRVLSLSSSKIEYNRDEFQHDTYHVAAKRVLAAFKKSFLYNAEQRKRPVALELLPYKDHSAKRFEIYQGKILHNYDNLDTWHWWLITEIERLIERMP